MSTAWTSWRPFDTPIKLRPRVLSELVDGGQAFRWWRQPDGAYLGQWSNHIAALRLAPSPTPGSPGLTPTKSDVGGVLHPDAPVPLEWSAPLGQAEQLAATLPRYLGFTPIQTSAIDQLPWRSDPHLARCLGAYPDLRILHQPLGETLLGFLCSATKQIVQIKQMLALLAQHHGSPLATTCNHYGYKQLFQLPTWEQLAAAPEEKLRACQLGFRAPYISGTAKFLSAHPGWLEETEILPYAAAKTRLLTLPGVGEKIADCVLLFGCGHLEAFPVDTWMIKSMARRYELTDWKPPQIAHFGRTHFGAAAGIAQQVLFAWEREFGKSTK